MRKNGNKNNSDCFTCNVREKVLDRIKNQKVRMHSPCLFLAKKIGLESICVFFIFLGALFIGFIFYFFEKKILLDLNFLRMGRFSLYGYIIFFIASIGLAVFFANQSQLFCGGCRKTKRFSFFFFLIALILGALFVTFVI